MATSTTKTNKPFNPRAQDASPLAYNRAALYSGKALDFDGVNDYVAANGFAGTLSNNDAWTACGYFKTAGVSRGTWFSAHDVGGGNVIRVGIEGSQTLGLFYADQYTTDVQIGDFDFRDDKWHFVALSRAQGVDGSLVTLFVDGVELTSRTSGPKWSSATQFSLGQEWDGGATSDFWDGLLSNFKIFNTALTAAQIADLYNFPEKIVPTGVDNTALKLWLPMMEGAGTTAYDGSGNGNHGTINGATYVNGIGAAVAQTSVIDWNKGVNLLTYSEEFNESSYWTPAQSTITANDTTAPDGQTTADKLLASATNSNHQIDGSFFSIVSGAITSSIYAKKGNTNFVRLRHNSSTQQIRAWFDLENGVTGVVDSPGTSTIEDAGNGWYRCTMTEAGNTKTGLMGLQIFINESDSQTNWLADGDEYIHIWGASLEQSATAGPYVPTLSTAQPTPVLLPAGLTTGRDITGVNLFENVRKQGALNLDGQSWAEVHDNASLDVSAITLECWIYWQNGSDDGIIAKWSGTTERSYMIYKLNSTTARFYLSTNGSNQTNTSVYTSFSEGNWYHIVGTYDGATMKTYTNGALFNSAALTGNIFGNSKPLEIGRFDENDTLISPDSIAQPRIYNRALTAEEVQRNYNAGKNIYS